MSSFLGLSSSPFQSRAPTPADATRTIQSQIAKDQSDAAQIKTLTELGLLGSSGKRSKVRDRERDKDRDRGRGAQSHPNRGGSAVAELAGSQPRKNASTAPPLPISLFYYTPVDCAAGKSVLIFVLGR
jgi:hypothetical protein